MGFEIAEQLGWRAPRHTVVPMASGSLLTKIHKAYKEFTQLGLIEHTHFTVHGAQATGCSPITEGMKKGSDLVKPVAKPQTIAKSLAIGTPADGYYAIHTMRDTGGSAEDASDEEIIEGIKMLAECEGIFAETAGGVTVACAKKLIETGKIGPNESTVLCITGHGLKTAEAVAGHCGAPRLIKPSLREFEELIRAELPAAGPTACRSDSTLLPSTMPTNIRIPTPLRKLTAEREVVQAEGSTIGEILQSLDTSYPGLKERICDEQGNVRRFVNVYLNDEDIRFLDEKATAVKDGRRNQHRARHRRGLAIGFVGSRAMIGIRAGNSHRIRHENDSPRCVCPVVRRSPGELRRQAGFQAGQPHRFRHSRSLCLRRTAADDWESDVMGKGILANGASVDIHFAPSDKTKEWDLKVVDGTGKSIVWEKLDLLEISKVTLHYTDGKATAEVE